MSWTTADTDAGALDRATADRVPTPPGVVVVGLLGRGARSEVYRVRRDGATWAMKLFRGSFAEDAAAMDEFRREAALLASIDHPSLVRVHDVGQIDGRPYLVMDLVEGRELTATIEAGPMTAADVVRIGAQLADGLAAAHRRGVVHRDVKPQNVIVEPSGRVRLIDLGLARRHATGASGPSPTDRTDDGGHDEGAGHDDDGRAAGTLQYAAPEQSGVIARPVDARSDLYSLGIVLFECATGRHPFAAADVGELLRMHATEVPPRVDELRPELPASLADAIATLVAKDADDRYADADELLAVLRAIATELAPGAEEPDDRRRGGPSDRERTPLFGRDDELARLVGHWEAARAGDGRIVVVAGAPGTGRSRLARELCARATADGLVGLGSATAAPVPLGALRTALSQEAHPATDGEPDGGSPRAAMVAVERLSPSLRRAATRLLTTDVDGAHTPSGDGSEDVSTQDLALALREIARLGGGLLLCLDDVEALDDSTRHVCRHLAGDLSGVPLMLVGFGIAAEPGARAAPPMAELATAADDVVDLEPLPTAAVGELLRAAAGSAELDDVTVDRLATRCGGRPADVLSYLDAIIEHGALLPSWGRWRLDEDRLAQLQLPADVRGLALRRVDELDDATRRSLAVAAIIGGCVEPDVLRGVTNDVAALHAGVALRILEPTGDGAVRFVSDAVRVALAGSIEPAARPTVHQRVAEALDRLGPSTHDRQYRVAWHRLSGRVADDPHALLDSCLRAARLALDELAPATAVELLEAATTRLREIDDDVRHAAGVTAADLEPLEALLGVALFRAGRLGEASERIERAAARATDPVERAELLEELGNIRNAVWDGPAAGDAARAGLAAIGCEPPRLRLLLVLTSIVRALVALAIERTGVRFGTASGDGRRRREIETRLLLVASSSAAENLELGTSVAYTCRALGPAVRLGTSTEYVRARTMLSLLVSAIRPGRTSAGFERAEEAARQVGDERLASFVRWVDRSAGHLMGTAEITLLSRDVTRDAHLLNPMEIIPVIGGCIRHLLVRGYVDDARQLCQLAQDRLAADDLTSNDLRLVDLATAAGRGELAAAHHGLEELLSDVGPVSGHGARLSIVMSRAYVTVERGATAEALEDIERDLATVPVLSWRALHIFHGIHAFLADGWLEVARTAADPAAARARAAAAIRTLGRCGGNAALRAHHLVASAHLRHLDGDGDGALDALARGDDLLRSASNPRATYEAARLRARILGELGHDIEAAAHAAIARDVAERHGWPHRVRWVTAEHRTEPGHRSTSSGLTVSGLASAGNERLAAIEAMSRASARMVDPVELTRVALDHTIRILSADRAFLFLLDDDGETLVPRLGRDAAGEDLTSITDHGSTLVERVRAERVPIVVTGDDRRAALGSESVVVHGLRSIMVAPLELDGRLLGVIYLDSRVAKGLFTEKDLGVLAAITNHVAVSLETARAAQLAAAVRTAEHGREIAERLRRTSAELSATLDPDEVVERLVRSVRELFPCEHGAVLTWQDGGWRRHDADRDAALLTDRAAAPLVDLLTAQEVVRGDAAGPAVAIFDDRAIRSWVAIRLHLRDEALGCVLLAAQRAGAFPDVSVELAAALAGHGVIAYENASRFVELRTLSRTDALTGLHNRRRFFELAERRLQRSTDDVVAVMIDIDRFKSINDVHGHRVGDQVISEVAARLERSVRQRDVLGRYGGEEFAVLATARTPTEGATLGERLRAAVAGAVVDTDAGPLDVTVSVGVHWPTEPGGTPDLLLNHADRALYAAKRGGRNRVVLEE